MESLKDPIPNISKEILKPIPPPPGVPKSNLLMNDNGYGDGAKNNTIGYGDGACNNDINWGIAQKNSWSPSTDLFPCAPVSNKKSYNNEFFGFGTTPILSALNDTDFLADATEFTCSFWLKVIPDSSTWTDWVVPLSKTVAGRGGRDFLIFFGRPNPLNPVQLRIWINETEAFTNNSLNQNMGQWNHVFFRYQSTKLAPYISEVYINNILITNEFIQPPVSFQTASKVFSIGAETSTVVSEEMDITKIGLWNRTLTITEKTNIYNSGCPTDLAPWSPNMYLKIDDYTTNNGELQFPDSGSAIGTWESLSEEAEGISPSVPCP